MDNLIYFFIFFIGACFGSFANVVIYRFPRGESVVRPRSHCMQCQCPVAWYDNIPILSWFILRGRCRHCTKSFSFRYPLVEFIMAALFLGLYLKFGFCWLFLEYLIFVFALVIACFIDIDHMILPDVFTLSGIVIGLVGASINPEREFLPALWGVLFGGGVLYAVAALYAIFRNQEGLGGGDIKLLAWIGALLGWTSVPFVILVSSLVGSVAGLIIMSKTKGGLSHAIPFGPYLGFAAILFIFFGQEISEIYIRIFLPSLMPLN